MEFKVKENKVFLNGKLVAEIVDNPKFKSPDQWHYKTDDKGVIQALKHFLSDYLAKQRFDTKSKVYT